MGAGLFLVGPKYKLRKHGCAHNHITPEMKRRTQSFNFLKMTLDNFKTNKMKSCCLLILFLLTVCEASQQDECRTWVEFTCRKGRTTEKHIKNEAKRHPEVFRELKSEESWKKMCYKPKSSSGIKKPSVKIDCQEQFNQTAYKTTKTTITCDDEGDNKAIFFCRESNSVCENMAESRLQSNSRFNLTKTNRKFSLSISDVSLQDQGVYWCAVNITSTKVVIKKIQLTVQHIRKFTRSPTAGQNFTYWCNSNASRSKFICKGEDPSICQQLVKTSESDKNKKFFINYNNTTNITVTIRNVTADDSGTYWCGAQSDDKQRSNTFFNRLILTVVSPTPSTSTISSTTATAATTATVAAAVRPGVSEAIFSVIVCVAVLLFVILMTLIYKRFSCSKNTGSGAAACRTKEDCTYEEIQERLQLPDSENTTNTIYATVGSPNLAPSTHYATVNFQNSDTAAGETLRLSSSACEYSTVKFPKCPTDSSDTQMHRPTEECLYSTVNKPRK